MKKTKKAKKSKKINYEILALAAILLFALFLRVYELEKPVLWIDEATSAMAGRMIIEKGEPVFDSGLNYSRAKFFHYVLAGFLSISENDFMARFPSVIFGLLTIILSYFIGKEYSKSGGILAALFMSVFYLEVFFSRQARFYQLFQLMFFLSLYLLYKSKEKPVYLIPAIICFFIAYDTHLAGLILAPFFILHILIYNKKWQKLSALLPAIPLVKKFMPTISLSSGSSEIAANYASNYFAFARNLRYLLILAVPGAIWAYFKNKRLSLLIILPSLAMLIGIISLETFALRYAYFFVFPLVLYSSLLFSFLYEKYGNLILASIFLLLIFPSNLFFPYSYVNIIKPIGESYADYTTPEIDIKDMPENIKAILNNENSTVITYFSSSFEWYYKKPDYVLPFSMDGRGEDQISYINKNNETVDRYSGAKILTAGIKLSPPYYIIADEFSTSKLKPGQKEFLNNLTEGCDLLYKELDIKVYSCQK